MIEREESIWVPKDEVSDFANIFRRRYKTADGRIYTFYDADQFKVSGYPVAWEFPVNAARRLQRSQRA